MTQAIQSLSQVSADRLNSLNYNLEALENLSTVLLQDSAKSQDIQTGIFHGCTMTGAPKGNGSLTDGTSLEARSAQRSNSIHHAQNFAEAAPSMVKEQVQSSSVEAYKEKTALRSKQRTARSKSRRSLASPRKKFRTIRSISVSTDSPSSPRRGR